MNYDIIDDYIVSPVEDTGWCGVLFMADNWAVWVFKGRPHGYDIAFGLKGGTEGRNWN